MSWNFITESLQRQQNIGKTRTKYRQISTIVSMILFFKYNAKYRYKSMVSCGWGLPTTARTRSTSFKRSKPYFLSEQGDLATFLNTLQCFVEAAVPHTVSGHEFTTAPSRRARQGDHGHSTRHPRDRSRLSPLAHIHLSSRSSASSYVNLFSSPTFSSLQKI